MECFFLETEFKLTRNFQNLNSNSINSQMGVEFFNNANSNIIVDDMQINKFFPNSLLKEYTNKVISKVKKNNDVDNIQIFISDEIQNVNVANQFFEERMWGRVKALISIKGRNFSITPQWNPFPNYCDWSNFDDLADEIIEHSLRVPTDLPSIEYESHNIPIVFASPSSGVLLHEVFGHLLEADFFISSPFKDYYNNKIGSEELSIIDNGTLGLHCISKYDDEGTKLQETTLISKGVLKTPLVDKRFSTHLNVPLTGNGWKDLANGTVCPRMTTIYALPGDKKLDTLKNSIAEGLMVYSLQGGQVDVSTGNFTLYTEESYLINNGLLTHKVNPTIIYGNAVDALGNITGIGNDLKFTKMICGKMGQFMPVGIGGPSLLVEDLKIGRIVNGNNNSKSV